MRIKYSESEGKAMPRKSKENSMQRYEVMLRVSVRYLDFIRHPRFLISLSSSDKKRVDEAVHYVASVKKALNKVGKANRDFLKREFFDKTYDPYWWTKKYSKSSYYRKRNEAIKAFEEVFVL